MLKYGVLAVVAALSLDGCATEQDDVVATTASALTLKTDYALGKPTSQSSTAFGGDSARAVDNNTNGAWAGNSVTHTDWNTHAWWQVDLLQPRAIDTVQVWGRTDPCCTSRLSSYYVLTSLKQISDDLETALGDPNVTAVFIPGQSALPVQAVGIYKSARYVRVQLAGTNYLSLAEVQVLDRANDIPGPNSFAAKTTWTATSTVTSSNAFAMVEASDTLKTYQRGADGFLTETTDDGTPLDVPGAPLITSDGVSAVTEPTSGHTFVVARATDGNAVVAERNPSTNTWSFAEVAVTDAAPAIAVSCGVVYLAVRNGSWMYVYGRPLTGSSWTFQNLYSNVRTPPSLVGSNSGVGLGYVANDNWIYFARSTCGGAIGSAVTPQGTSPSTTRIGVVAFGNLFGVAVQGMDNNPYFALQSYDANNQPQWTGFEAVDRPVALIESPTLVVYRDLIFMAARDTQNQLRYWVRDPNFQMRISGQVTWTGGNVVSGFGTGATPPAFATRGTRDLWDFYGYEEHPEAELYVATKGIGDQRIYALNFGRFATYDVLHNIFGIQLNTAYEANDVDPRIVGNFPDFLPGLLQFPSQYWWTIAHPAPCNGTPLTLIFSTNVTSGTWYQGCTGKATDDNRYVPAPGVLLDGNVYAPWIQSEELGHDLQWGVPGFKTQPGYAVNFNARTPQYCTQNSDCGTDVCAPPPADFGTRYVCQTTGYGHGGTRPRGYVDWYDLDSDEHSFIDFTEWYRWWGDELREMVFADLGHGNTLLRDKYAWVKAYYYNGVEFQGRHSGIQGKGRLPGQYGFPLH